jgi:two-component system sensor histidine kinase GlrK
MKLATRMAVCLTLLAGLLIGTSLYQLQQVERIHSISRDLGDTPMEAGRLSIRLMQDVEVLREFGQKALVIGDPAYFQGWAVWEEAVGADLAKLQALELSGREAHHRESLLDAWRYYGATFTGPVRDSLMVAAATSTFPVFPDSVRPSLDDRLVGVIDAMVATTDSLAAANDDSIERGIGESALAVDRARSTAWTAGAGSLVLAVVLSLGLFFYTSGPLRRLNDGTREISGGNLDHRIRVSGGGELAKLAEHFNTMASKLAEVDELKKDFVSHVSHELKGPVAAIQETHLILLERIPGPLTPKQAHLLELSTQTANRLSVMIGNLLSVSRLEAGSMQCQFEVQDVAEVTCDVVDELSALAEDKELDVHLEFTPSWLSCDSERLREVVANLVGNAYKFSPRGGEVRIAWKGLPSPPERFRSVRIGREGAAGPYLLLAVEDQGPGVPAAHKEGIFEKFYQVRRHTKTKGQGVGLGLAIARKIVEAHGGRIWVEDGEGGGSRFQAIFPGAVSSPHPVEEERAEASTGSGTTPRHVADFGLQREQSRSGTG